MEVVYSCTECFSSSGAITAIIAVLVLSNMTDHDELCEKPSSSRVDKIEERVSLYKVRSLASSILVGRHLDDTSVYHYTPNKVAVRDLEQSSFPGGDIHIDVEAAAVGAQEESSLPSKGENDPNLVCLCPSSSTIDFFISV